MLLIRMRLRAQRTEMHQTEMHPVKIHTVQAVKAVTIRQMMTGGTCKEHVPPVINTKYVKSNTIRHLAISDSRKWVDKYMAMSVR